MPSISPSTVYIYSLCPSMSVWSTCGCRHQSDTHPLEYVIWKQIYNQPLHLLDNFLVSSSMSCSSCKEVTFTFCHFRNDPRLHILRWSFIPLTFQVYKFNCIYIGHWTIIGIMWMTQVVLTACQKSCLLSILPCEGLILPLILAITNPKTIPVGTT